MSMKLHALLFPTVLLLALSVPPQATAGLFDKVVDLSSALAPTPKADLYEAMAKSDAADLVELIDDDTADMSFYLVLGDALAEGAKQRSTTVTRYLSADDKRSDNYLINLATAKVGLLHALQKGKVSGSATQKCQLASLLIEVAETKAKTNAIDPKDKQLAQEAVKLWEGNPEALAKLLASGKLNLLQYAIKLGKARPSVTQSLENGLAVDWKTVAISKELGEKFFRSVQFLRSLYAIKQRPGVTAKYKSGWLISQSDITEFYNSALFKEKETWTRTELSDKESKEPRVLIANNKRYNIERRLTKGQKSYSEEENEMFSALEGLMAFAKAGKVKWAPKEGLLSMVKRGEPISNINRTEWKGFQWGYSRKYFYIPLEDGLLCAIIMEDETLLNTLVSQYLEQNENVLPDIVLDYWANRSVRPNATRQALIMNVFQAAIEKGHRFSMDVALAGAYNLGNEKTLELLLDTRQAFPQELAKRADKNSLAKTLLRKAILAGKPLDSYGRGGVNSENLSTLFANDTEVLAKLRSVGTDTAGVSFDKPFEAYSGGNLQSGNYYLDKADAILKSAIRVPKGATVNINLMGNALNGADLIVAEGGTLALYNGNVFTKANPEKFGSGSKQRNKDYHEIRNRGTLILDGVTVATNIINNDSGVLTLRNKARVGRDNQSGPIQGDPFALAQTMREMNRETQLEARYGDMNKAVGNQIAMAVFAEMLKGDPPTGVTNTGKIILDSAFINTIQNSGTMEGKDLVGYVLRNDKAGNVKLVDTRLSSVDNLTDATFVASGRCNKIKNLGSMRLTKMTFEKLEVAANATIELNESGVGAPTTKVTHHQTGEVLVAGSMALSGTCFFPETTITLNGGTLIGHSLDDASKTYTGDTIVFTVKDAKVGQILVKETPPGKFTARLDAGFFPEEVDSETQGLKNLTVVEE